jgi:hypothetical protein
MITDYKWDEGLNDEQRAVVKIDLGDDNIWYMDWDDWNLAQQEGRTKPVVFKDKLILVDDETYLELNKLTDWLKNNI